MIVKCLEIFFEMLISHVNITDIIEKMNQTNKNNEIFYFTVTKNYILKYVTDKINLFYKRHIF